MSNTNATIPRFQITEEDLLNFQITHFNDHSVPQDWFIKKDAADALTLDSVRLPSRNADYNDLGFYPDGTARTLTDADIEYFRQAEMLELQMKREQPTSRGDDLTTSANDEVPMTENEKVTKRNRGRRRQQNDHRKSNAQRHDYQQYVDDEDNDTGFTYRRKARELDAQTSTQINMDY